MSLDKRLAELCRLSYAGAKAMRKHTNYEVIHTLSDRKTDTQCYICVTKDKQIHIVFRGTEPESVTDWSTDLKFTSTKFLGYKTHRGFVQALRSVMPGIIAVIEQYIGHDIYCTGHSLGGALALLCALECPLKVKKVVTFGQPKTISPRASKELRGTEYIRYVNNADTVPKMPFKWMASYRHFGELVYIDRKGKIHHNPHYLFRFFDGLGNFHGRFTDHSIDNYINNIK